MNRRRQSSVAKSAASQTMSTFNDGQSNKNYFPLNEIQNPRSITVKRRSPRLLQKSAISKITTAPSLVQNQHEEVEEETPLIQQQQSAVQEEQIMNEEAGPPAVQQLLLEIINLGQMALPEVAAQDQDGSSELTYVMLNDGSLMPLNTIDETAWAALMNNTSVGLQPDGQQQVVVGGGTSSSTSLDHHESTSEVTIISGPPQESNENSNVALTGQEILDMSTLETQPLDWEGFVEQQQQWENHKVNGPTSSLNDVMTSTSSAFYSNSPVVQQISISTDETLESLVPSTANFVRSSEQLLINVGDSSTCGVPVRTRRPRKCSHVFRTDVSEESVTKRFKEGQA